jgi:hypothetical protein
MPFGRLPDKNPDSDLDFFFINKKAGSIQKKIVAFTHQ